MLKKKLQMDPEALKLISELHAQGIKVYFFEKMIRCGNPRCQSCPHGPYWYGYWLESIEVENDKEPSQGRRPKKSFIKKQIVHCFYIGKAIDPELIVAQTAA